MAISRTSEVLRTLGRAVLLREGTGLTDGQLLEDYLSQRDETAFAALVRRHGPMVWGVCRRVLGEHHDAEDAFQATFLVLIRKAASIAPREMLPNWLYGVAHQTAIRARALTARRKGRERQVTPMPEPAVGDHDLSEDLLALLDQELSQLPDKYRVAIVVCDLEGKTRKEAARQLGCPEGTLAARVARGRKMLAKRLARHSVVSSGGVLAAVLARNTASAGVPTAVVSSTIKAASLFAAGQAAGAISVKVAALTEGVLKTMLLTKLKVAMAVLVAVAIAGVGAGGLLHGTQAAEPVNGQQRTSKKEEQAADAPKKEPVKKDEDAIQGTWVLVKLEQGNAEPEDPKGTFQIVIAGEKITFPDKSEATFKLDSTKEPKRIEFTVEKGGKATTAPGIYSLKGGELKYCHGREGDTEPPASFDIKKAAPGTFPTCWTFRRGKDEKPKQGEAKIDKATVEARRAIFKGEIDRPHDLVVRIERDEKPLESRTSARAGEFAVVVEASDKIHLRGGKTGHGFVVTIEQGTVKTVFPVALTEENPVENPVAGTFAIRREADFVTKDGVLTFADVTLKDGKKLPVTFRLERKKK